MKTEFNIYPKGRNHNIIQLLQKKKIVISKNFSSAYLVFRITIQIIKKREKNSIKGGCTASVPIGPATF